MLIGLVLASLTILVACTSPVATPAQVATTAPSQAQTDEPAPASPTSPPAEPQAALVNGTPILMSDYEHQVAQYEASLAAAGQDPNTPEGQATLAEGRAWVLEIMIEQVLIEHAAKEAGVTVTNEALDATIQSLYDEIGQKAFEDWLANEGMSLDEMRERLRGDMIATQMANQIAESVPTHSEHIQARHILVPTEEEAKQILSQLQAGGDFVSLARTYSQDISTRDTGGDLGYFPKGILTSPEVEAAAFALQPGQISAVIPSSLGYHIVQVVQRNPDMEISPENLRLLRDKAVQEWLDGLRAAADIQRFVSSTP